MNAPLLAGPSRARYTRAMRVVRRVHLYAGLLMFPWALFYGLSGILFNHPNVGEKVTGRPMPPPLLSKHGGPGPWPPAAVANQVVAALNAGATAGAYRLDPEFAARYSGVAVLKAPVPGGQHFLLLDLARGGGVLATRHARPTGPPAPFAGRLDLPPYSLATIEERLGGLLAAQALPGERLRVDPRRAPRLELRLIDREGVRWDATFDVGDGRVAGRRSDRWPGIGLSQLSAMLHTTHHFPLKVGPRWFWALFQDLLGVIMVVWAVSGVLMWWQLKATRTLGLGALALAMVVAGLVFYGTTREITFGDVAQALGPGE